MNYGEEYWSNEDGPDPVNSDSESEESRDEEERISKRRLPILEAVAEQHATPYYDKGYEEDEEWGGGYEDDDEYDPSEED